MIRIFLLVIHVLTFAATLKSQNVLLIFMISLAQTSNFPHIFNTVHGPLAWKPHQYIGVGIPTGKRAASDPRCCPNNWIQHRGGTLI